MVAGHDCPFDEFLPRYLQHVRDNLLDQLPELFGKILVVDAITTFPSEGDALAGLVFEALSEQARAPRAVRTRKSAKRLVNRSFPKALGIALAPLVDASQVFSVYLRQEDVFAASKETFLGLDHDLSCALSEGYVTFWARDRMFSKMRTSFAKLRDPTPFVRALPPKCLG